MADFAIADMFIYFAHGLIALFEVKTFLALCFGVFLGFWVGILPGVGGPTTLALLIPFSFTMEPFPAFAMLLGMISVAGTAGDITAILFGVPGESTNAATMIDGVPMAKNGEAGRALGASLVSSMIGAIIGAFLLALAMIFVRPLVLSVGYAEFFMLSLAGIAFLASLTSASVFKGLAAGALGLILATVGISSVTGIERYTFGSLFLWDGISFIPAILGLFAIPELIDMSTGGSRLPAGNSRRVSNPLQGAMDAVRHLGLVFRCSALAVYIGLIPGMGASISQWIAYAHAAQTSKDRSKMGRGAVEGVIGPGAACTATMSGGLIPTIGFGVPGTPQMAILLGAFLIQGLTPGPDMLTPESDGGHLTLTFSMVWMIIVANILIVLASLAFLNHLARVAYLDENLLVPFILVLLIIGAFADKNSINDIWLCLAFGFIGWVMMRLDWPRPPLILGLVLGALIETNLYLTVQAYGFSWLAFPSVITIFLVILLSIFWPFLKSLWRPSLSGSDTGPAENAAEVEDNQTRSQKIGDLAVILALLVVFTGAAALSFRWPTSTRVMPMVISAGGLIFVVVQLALTSPSLFRAPATESFRAALKPPADIQIVGRIGASFISYLGLIYFLGFTYGTALFLLIYFRLFASIGWWRAIVYALLGSTAFYVIFQHFLALPFAEGRLLEMVAPWIDLSI